MTVRDANADSSVGNRAGSGFLTCEKRAGNCARSEVMIDLPGQHVVRAFLETENILGPVRINEKSIATKRYERVLDIWHNKHLSSFQIFLQTISHKQHSFWIITYITIIKMHSLVKRHKSNF